MTYAAKTDVPIHQTFTDINKLVSKHGGAQFTFGLAEDRAVVGFTKEGRQVRYIVSLAEMSEQRKRSLMRAMLLTIKGKLEGAAAGVESFEEAFLAQIVLPDGKLVGDMVRGEIAIAYSDGRQPPNLLPDYSGGKP